MVLPKALEVATQSNSGTNMSSVQHGPVPQELSSSSTPYQAYSVPTNSYPADRREFAAELESPPFSPLNNRSGIIDSIASSTALSWNPNVESRDSRTGNGGFYHQMYKPMAE